MWCVQGVCCGLLLLLAVLRWGPQSIFWAHVHPRDPGCKRREVLSLVSGPQTCNYYDTCGRGCEGREGVGCVKVCGINQIERVGGRGGMNEEISLGILGGRLGACEEGIKPFVICVSHCALCRIENTGKMSYSSTPVSSRTCRVSVWSLQSRSLASHADFDKWPYFTS